MNKLKKKPYVEESQVRAKSTEVTTSENWKNPLIQFHVKHTFKNILSNPQCKAYNNFVMIFKNKKPESASFKKSLQSACFKNKV